MRGVKQGQTDSGVTARVFGSPLAWLNDHESNVFFVGTCNDVSKLPLEFVGAERFDGVFFIDLLDVHGPRMGTIKRSAGGSPGHTHRMAQNVIKKEATPKKMIKQSRPAGELGSFPLDHLRMSSINTAIKANEPPNHRLGASKAHLCHSAGHNQTMPTDAAPRTIIMHSRDQPLASCDTPQGVVRRARE